MKTVVFACVHNAGRSQMAVAFFSALVDPRRGRGVSAGTQPGARVHAEVVTAMREAGIDLSNATPQRLTDDLMLTASVLVTMGCCECGEDCPFMPGLRREDWPLEDPKGQTVAAVRRIRDDIRDRVRKFVDREQLGRS